MLQPGLQTSSTLRTGNRKFIFLSTAGQLSFASFFFCFCHIQMLEKINNVRENKLVRQRPVLPPSSPRRSQVSEAHTGIY